MGCFDKVLSIELSDDELAIRMNDHSAPTVSWRYLQCLDHGHVFRLVAGFLSHILAMFPQFVALLIKEDDTDASMSGPRSLCRSISVDEKDIYH
jgi:hypothetical protein